MAEPESEAGRRTEVPGAGTARVVAGQLTRDSWQRPWYAHVIAYVVSVLVMVPAIWLCDWLLSGFHTDRPEGPIVFAAI